jgi:uncharacterized protein HemY
LFARSNPDMDPSSVNSFCWNVLKNCDNQRVLEQCAQWMESASERKPEFEILDTYARLLAKIGKKETAISIMEKAIQAGKATGAKTRDSEVWLKNQK